MDLRFLSIEAIVRFSCRKSALLGGETIATATIVVPLPLSLLWRPAGYLPLYQGALLLLLLGPALILGPASQPPPRLYLRSQLLIYINVSTGARPVVCATGFLWGRWVGCQRWLATRTIQLRALVNCRPQASRLCR